MGQTSFTAARVALAVLMDSLVNILIPTRTWPTTNTAVEDLSNLPVGEPHTLPKSLLWPVRREWFYPRTSVGDDQCFAYQWWACEGRGGQILEPRAATVSVVWKDTGVASAGSFVEQFVCKQTRTQILKTLLQYAARQLINGIAGYVVEDFCVTRL